MVLTPLINAALGMVQGQDIFFGGGGGREGKEEESEVNNDYLTR